MKSLSVVAIAAVASQVLAEPKPKPEPMPYKPVKAFLSTRDIFGLDRRDADGYHPFQSICGAGTTCADACGDQYSQCASSDHQLHCYDVQSNESCCSDGTGNSCSAGFYCSADSTGQTWCCPEGMDLDTCASKYHVTGSLHSNSAILPSSTTSSKVIMAKSTSEPSEVTSSVTFTSSALLATSIYSTHLVTSIYSTYLVTPSPSSAPSVTHRESSIPSVVFSASSAPSVVSSTSIAPPVASSTSSGSSPFIGGDIFFEAGNSTALAIAASGTGAYSPTTATSRTSTITSGAASATGSSTTSGASSSKPATSLVLLGAAALVAFL